MLQLWSKHHFVRLANPLLKTLTYLTRDHALIKVCTSLVVPPRILWASNTAERDTWKQSKTIKVITRWEYVSLSAPRGVLAAHVWGGLLTSGKGILILTFRSRITLVLSGGVSLEQMTLQHPGWAKWWRSSLSLASKSILSQALVRELCRFQCGSEHLEFIV